MTDVGTTPSDALVIVTATASDLPALEAIYREASLHGPDYREALAAHPELFVLDPAGAREGRTRAARDPVSGELVGFATIGAPRDGVCELDDLFVSPAWMGRGVARRLVADVSALAWTAGATHIEVVGNPQALAFYRSVGFVVIGSAETPLGPAPRLRLGPS